MAYHGVGDYGIMRWEFVSKGVENAGVIAALLGSLGVKLYADTPTDVVNGYVSCGSEKGVFKIIVEIYEVGEAPNAAHTTTFEKPAVMPTKEQCETTLRSLGKID